MALDVTADPRLSGAIREVLRALAVRTGRPLADLRLVAPGEAPAGDFVATATGADPAEALTRLPAGADRALVRLLVVEHLAPPPDPGPLVMLVQARPEHAAATAAAVLLALDALARSDDEALHGFLTPSEELVLDRWLEARVAVREDGATLAGRLRSLDALAARMLRVPGTPEEAAGEVPVPVRPIEEAMRRALDLDELVGDLPSSLATWDPEPPALKARRLGETVAHAARRLREATAARLGAPTRERIHALVQHVRAAADGFFRALRLVDETATGPDAPEGEARLGVVATWLDALRGALHVEPDPADEPDADPVARAEAIGREWIEAERAFLRRAIRAPDPVAVGALALATAAAMFGVTARIPFQGKLLLALGPAGSPLRLVAAAAAALLALVLVVRLGEALRRHVVREGEATLEAMARQVEELNHEIARHRLPAARSSVRAVRHELLQASRAMEQALHTAWRGVREHVVLARRDALARARDAWAGARPPWWTVATDGPPPEADPAAFTHHLVDVLLPAVLRYPEPPQVLPISGHRAVLDRWLATAGFGPSPLDRTALEQAWHRVAGPSPHPHDVRRVLVGDAPLPALPDDRWRAVAGPGGVAVLLGVVVRRVSREAAP